MSSFLKILKKHQAEIDRMIEEQEHGTPMTYSLMQSMGMLKPFAVRLPIPLIAALDEVAKHGLWRSKQEMVYDMIHSAYLDFFESSSDETRAKLQQVQNSELKKLTSKMNASTLAQRAANETPSNRPVKRKRAKRV